jgi:excisionase family DNA binding protein
MLVQPAESQDAGHAPLLDNTTDCFPACRLLTVDDAARFLSLSSSTVRRLQQARKIPFAKVGGSIRFLMKDLRSYVEKARVAAIGS